MNWQQILLLVVIAAVFVILVWRGSKKSGCSCGHVHDHEADEKKKAARTEAI